MEDLSQKRFTDTLAPEAVSAELLPIVKDLGVLNNCRELANRGWTVVEAAAAPEFTTALRDAILKLSSRGGANMLLAKDKVFAEAVLQPKLLALAEFSVGRGFLLSQVAASVREKNAPCIGLHADHNWLPAPFPEHNMLLTACWACDEYSEAGGATLIVPGSGAERRHPSQQECEDLVGAIAVECPAGSIVVWDGNVWHSNYPRVIDGQRVVCHITYSRLMMRPVENYALAKSELISAHGARMAQLLGDDDFLDSPNGADYSKLTRTFNNAKR